MQIPFISQLADDEQQNWIALLNQQLTLQSLHYTVVKHSDFVDNEKANAQFAIVANPQPQAISQYPHLKWIQSLWAGVERLMAELPADKLNCDDFTVVRLIDPRLAQTMAEAVVAWSFYLMRDMPTYQQQQLRNNWQQLPVKLASETTVAVLGLGELGQCAASLLVNNQFNAIGWSRTEKSINHVRCYSGEQGLKTVLGQADIIVCLLPLTPATHHLIDQQKITWLKNNATIINFARGAIIDNSALISALNNGQIKHAVLDVFEQEPLAETSPLWQQPNITILPHISAPTHLQSAGDIVVSNIEQYVNKGIIPDGIKPSLGY